MKHKNFIIRYRWWFIIGPIILTVLSVLLLVRVQINSDLESYFPNTLPSKINAKKVEATFGKSEPMLLLFETDDVLKPETLERISELQKEFSRQKMFDDVISLFSMKTIRGEDGMMLVDPLIKRIPKSVKGREKLRESIRENELAYKTVVSEDFRYSLLLLKIANGASDQEVMQKVNEILSKHPGNEKVLINGLPYLRNETNVKIGHDIMILLPIALLVMIIFLLISFREFRGVWLPISVVIISTVVSMAILPVMHWDLSLIGVLIPIMMIAIANNYGVHFVSYYQEMNALHPHWGMQRIVIETLHHLKKPIALTGLTTIVGILGLLTHLMIPARQMGVISGFGVGLALLLSLSFIPAILSLLKKGKVHKEFIEEKNGFFGQILSNLSTVVIRKPQRVILVFTIVFVLIGSGMSFIKVASNNDEVLPKKHPYNQTIQIANRWFGGTKFMTLYFEGEIQDPQVLKRMDYYASELKKMPEIGSVTSLSTVMKIMSRAMNDKGSVGYNEIPETREAVAQYLLLYSMSGDPEDFESLVNFDYTKAVMDIQFNAGNMKTLNKVIDKVEELTANDPLHPILSGYSLTEKEMAISISRGQIYSLLFALVSIFMLLVWIFRSIAAGLIGSIPLAFAVICTFGLMGIFHIKLNILTALLSSISIGLGVDYTIHIFWRLKTEIGLGKSLPQAIVIALKNTGRGIVINAFSVILGFSVLYFSAFPYLKLFATLIVLSLFLCLICALVLIPAICLAVRPKFLERTGDGRMETGE